MIGDHQHFRGYTLFLYKEHGDKTELFMEEMKLVVQAAAKAFDAEKMYSDETRPNADELQNMKQLLSAALPVWIGSF